MSADPNPDLMALIGRHLDAENQHDWPGTEATLHPECVFEDVALGQTWRGRAGAREYYQLWWGAFDVVVHGERLHWLDSGPIAEARFVGRHVGDFLGLAATQRPIDLRLSVFIDFRDGLMSGERFYWDTRGLLRQLGATRFPALDVG